MLIFQATTQVTAKGHYEITYPQSFTKDGIEVLTRRLRDIDPNISINIRAYKQTTQIDIITGNPFLADQKYGQTRITTLVNSVASYPGATSKPVQQNAVDVLTQNY